MLIKLNFVSSKFDISLKCFKIIFGGDGLHGPFGVSCATKGKKCRFAPIFCSLNFPTLICVRAVATSVVQIKSRQRLPQLCKYMVTESKQNKWRVQTICETRHLGVKKTDTNTATDNGSFHVRSTKKGQQYVLNFTKMHRRDVRSSI